MTESNFGARSDAKRAMKLHHRDGISLKKAWKEIKSGKKSKKSKKCPASCKCPKCRKAKGSPKQRRAQSKAKKAMKLYWKSKRSPGRSMSLKSAWKKVNKFGAYGDSIGQHPGGIEGFLAAVRPVVMAQDSQQPRGYIALPGSAAARPFLSRPASIASQRSGGYVPPPYLRPGRTSTSAAVSRMPSAIAGIPLSVQATIMEPARDYLIDVEGFGNREFISIHENPNARALRESRGAPLFGFCDKNPAGEDRFFNPFWDGSSDARKSKGRKCVKKCPPGKFLSNISGACNSLAAAGRLAGHQALRQGLTGNPRLSHRAAADIFAGRLPMGTPVASSMPSVASRVSSAGYPSSVLPRVSSRVSSGSSRGSSSADSVSFEPFGATGASGRNDSIEVTYVISPMLAAPGRKAGFYAQPGNIYVKPASAQKLRTNSAEYELNPLTGNAIKRCAENHIRSTWGPPPKCRLSSEVKALNVASRRAARGLPLVAPPSVRAGPGLPRVPPVSALSMASPELQYALSDIGKLEYLKWRVSQAGITTNASSISGLQNALNSRGVETRASFCGWLSEKGISPIEIMNLVRDDRTRRQNLSNSISRSGSMGPPVAFGRKMSFGIGCTSCKLKKF